MKEEEHAVNGLQDPRGDEGGARSRHGGDEREGRWNGRAPGGGAALAGPLGRRGPFGFGAGRIGLLALALVVALVLFIVPMPYVVESPGPTFDVAGQYRGTALIEVSGTDPKTGGQIEAEAAHEAGTGAGELRMVTVSESGGPGRRLNLVQLISAYFDSTAKIIPYSQAYPDSATKEQVDAAQSVLMRSSQSTAEAAALTHLGWEVPAKVTIRGATAGSDAEGKVEDGDVLVSVTDAQGVEHPIDRAATVFDLVKATPVGSVLTVNTERDGEPMSAKITTVSGGEGARGSRLGVYLDVDVDLPLQIAFNLGEVGGPSAGMMFALGIIDRLTPGDLMGGRSIAGTGTMSYDGEVGAIGGIVQKMNGAKRDGAAFFLAPASNCGEVVGNELPGLQVVAVSTLDEAVSAVKTIAAGDGESLPTCASALGK
ncbi:YlbL family protein [Schaalia hyovaginalis]|uniref:endopeptidase La n=1 Tax=Schaalia hyovaginalis TaxID=29316 RepID=A0A923E5T0_9ACTO|nr:PDZ domain-containing protein [Schaalia hyovaginalis]